MYFSFLSIRLVDDWTEVQSVRRTCVMQSCTVEHTIDKLFALIGRRCAVPCCTVRLRSSRFNTVGRKTKASSPRKFFLHGCTNEVQSFRTELEGLALSASIHAGSHRQSASSLVTFCAHFWISGGLGNEESGASYVICEVGYRVRRSQAKKSWSSKEKESHHEEPAEPSKRAALILSNSAMNASARSSAVGRISSIAWRRTSSQPG